jgi:dTDP-4-amino-4,6-dideoxygalactose transaminase
VAVAADYGMPVVEDAAEAVGSLVSGQRTGTFGFLGMLRFNGNKIVTTGGGGAVLTNDSDLALRAKHQTTTVKTAHGWEYAYDEIGYNYRMPNINAALGLAQLEQLPAFLESKRNLALSDKDFFVLNLHLSILILDGAKILIFESIFLFHSSSNNNDDLNIV